MIVEDYNTDNNSVQAWWLKKRQNDLTNSDVSIFFEGIGQALIWF